MLYPKLFPNTPEFHLMQRNHNLKFYLVETYVLLQNFLMKKLHFDETYWNKGMGSDDLFYREQNNVNNIKLMHSFPDSSVSKESTCNAGDPGSIPGLGRSPGERIAYPLQYSWASLVAQLVKNPPAMSETWVQSLSSEDPLEKGKATDSSVLAWRIPWTI